jgi:hypothetical protein
MTEQFFLSDLSQVGQGFLFVSKRNQIVVIVNDIMQISKSYAQLIHESTNVKHDFQFFISIMLKLQRLSGCAKL